MQVELPNEEKIKEWCQEKFSGLNPDRVPYLLMGVEALYVELGGKPFLEIVSQKGVKDA